VIALARKLGRVLPQEPKGLSRPNTHYRLLVQTLVVVCARSWDIFLDRYPNCLKFEMSGCKLEINNEIKIR